jgi:hypothetical protein
MIVEHLEAHAVGNNGRLPDGNVSKRTGMNHARLIFGGAARAGSMVLPMKAVTAPSTLNRLF